MSKRTWNRKCYASGMIRGIAAATVWSMLTAGTASASVIFEEIPTMEKNDRSSSFDFVDSVFEEVDADTDGDFFEEAASSDDVFGDILTEVFEEPEEIETGYANQIFETVIEDGSTEEGMTGVPVYDLNVYVPSSWEGKFKTEEENGTVWFIHTRSREYGASGKLFGIAVSDVADGTDLITEINGTFYSWVEAPMDIAGDLEAAMEFWTLAEGLYDVRTELHARYSFFWEETSGTELDFIPRYYQTYCTKESSDALSAALDGYRNGTITLNEIEKAVNELTYRTAEVPQIYITTADDNGNSLQKADGYVATDIVIANTDGSVTKNEKAMDCQIKVRGNSTSLAPKKPYNIKFSSKTNVLGMGKAKKWSLLANHYDPTMMRIYCVLKAAKEVGLPYTSECEFAELWVDGVFKGCYLVCESVEAGSTRVDIDKSNGEFIVEWQSSRVEKDVTYLSTLEGWRFECNDPDEPSQQQLDNMTSILGKVSAAFSSGDFNQVLQWIDLDSFAKYYVLNEWVKTCDFGETSAFFFWKDGKLYAGPAWDYDISSGNVIRDSNMPEGLYCERKNVYKQLCRYPEFQAAIRSAYAEMLPILSSVSGQGGLIDTLTENLFDMFIRNESEAGWVVGNVVYPYMRVPDATFLQNVSYLKNWLNSRIEWLSGYYLKTQSDGGYWMSLNGKRYYVREDGTLAAGLVLIGNKYESSASWVG